MKIDLSNTNQKDSEGYILEEQTNRWAEFFKGTQLFPVLEEFKDGAGEPGTAVYFDNQEEIELVLPEIYDTVDEFFGDILTREFEGVELRLQTTLKNGNEFHLKWDLEE